MLIHLCLNCGRISRNRIAGDDNNYVIIQLINEVDKPDANLMALLHSSNINPITQEERSLALTAIFGNDYEKCMR